MTSGPRSSTPGHKSSCLIFLRGQILGRAYRVLVDCGCSDLAMLSSFAARLGIETESLSAEPVTLANGS
jgi:predicted aspartyl protease